ncbi:MAG: hypothetical protein KatS3mg082_0749 [Nitrospiraceae bacterium]|nr:MAG: hypothetical protein KatS3mg082_0749 [Nitrospiraceae bacterium]
MPTEQPSGGRSRKIYNPQSKAGRDASWTTRFTRSSLHELVPISLFGFDISINQAVVMMWVVVGLAAWLMIAAASAKRLVPTKLQSLAEMLVEFVRGIILDTMGKDGMRFFSPRGDVIPVHLVLQLIGIDPWLLHSHEPDRRHGGLCAGGVRAQPCAGISAARGQVSGDPRAARYARLVAAADDPDRIDQPTGQAESRWPFGCSPT